MAALMEGNAFSPISSESDLLAVSSGATPGEIIITNKRKTFEIYQVSDRKPLKSWSVRHGVTLTSPVISWSDNGQDRFITVTNSQDVRLLDRDTVDFERAKKKHSSIRIHRVFVLPDHSPVLLYENGAVGFLSNIKESPGQGQLKEGETIHWCTALVKGTQMQVLFVAETKSGVVVYVRLYDRDSETWQHSCTEVTTPSLETTLCSCDGFKVSDTVSLYFLWSNQAVTKITVESGQATTSTSVQSVPGATAESSIVMLDSSHMAVTGVMGKGQAGIAIFNVKFGIQQTWQAFVEKPRSKHKVFCAESHIFVPCGRQLYAYKFDCQPSTVVSLLGQGLTTAELTTPDRLTGHFRWTAHGEGHHSVPEPAEAVSELFDKISDPSLSYRQFQDVFCRLLEQLSKPRLRYWLQGSQMATLIRRMLAETRYWPRDEINKLIAVGCIPHSLLGELCDSLIQHSEVSLVHKVIDSLPNIPERCLCKALGFYLSCEDSKLESTIDRVEEDMEDDNSSEEESDDDREKEKDGVSEKVKCPLSTQRAYLVNKILQMPYSDVFLLESLRYISFKHALSLLEYLCYLLQTRTASLKEADKQSSTDPLVLQVVDWLALVLDAHMTQFVLSPDSHVTLVNLKALVSNQVEFYGSLVTLEALLEQLKAKTIVKQEEKVGKYCIEVLQVL